jgi:hypothetical protein
VAWLILLIGSSLGAASLNGLVVDAAGSPVPQAQVFLEPGLGAGVLVTQAGADGRFGFDGLVPGPTGVFAIAPGFGWAGAHLNLTVGEAAQDVRLVLRPEARISGRVVDAKGDAIAGARITRIALLDSAKVGIPLAKLGEYGFQEPESDKEGRFTLGHVPAGATVALKVAHPGYAQEGVNDVPVGTENVKVTLYPGVVVQGAVASRDRGMAVANAAVVIRNAQPPHDSTITTTDNRGQFSVRLKPGVYMYQAIGSALRSAGWERLTLTGEEAMPRIRVMVAGAGLILGKVRDAVSGEPIAGARVALETYGNAAAVVQTGPTGEFQLAAGEGENYVRLDGAPGFLPAQDSALRLSIADGQTVELPDWFLVPLPTFNLQVIDEHEQPVPGVRVSIERPLQFGAYTTDGEGRVSFRVQSLPPDGQLIGSAEHPAAALGAVFALERKDAAAARVQLLPLATVSGRVVNGRGKGLEGIVVGGIFPGEKADQELLLWRTVTDDSGSFRWPAVVPGIPQRCVALAAGEATGQSEVFSLEPGGNRQLTQITIEDGEAATSLLGERFSIDSYGSVCGERPVDAAGHVFVFAPVAEAQAYASALDRLTTAETRPVLVVPGSYECGATTIPVLRGAPPARATTYVINADGRVILETFGMPPTHLLQPGGAAN